MKYAADFRLQARESLVGRWTVTVIAGIIAAMLGAISDAGPQVNIEFDENRFRFGLNIAGQEIFNSGSGLTEPFMEIFAGGVTFLVLAALVSAVLFFVLGSVVELGYARFNLDLIDREKAPEIGTLFGYFPHWSTAAVARFLRTLYVILWSLLFIIPGIVATYSYAMTGYILAENPELTASEAIQRSKEMMAGNRFRLFCLQFSFAGWAILCACTLGIGNLWLTPYVQAATAAFYREISVQ